MKRRGIGMAYVDKKKDTDRTLAELGDDINKRRMEEGRNRLEAFKKSLQEFATTHGDRIKKDPTLRYKFNAMCSTLGVDALGTGKGFWANFGIGDFYYELGAQIAEICLVTRTVNGGLITLEELTTRVKRRRPEAQRDQVSSDDVVYASKKLKALHSGFSVRTLGQGKTVFIQSVPSELSTDGLTILSCLDEDAHEKRADRGRTCPKDIGARHAWSAERVQLAVADLLTQSLLWEDEHDGSIWAPTIFGLE
eukprot:Rhum_TRINITY_DN4329_c0_g2::Rhum_TRINITY_DN4329_c0_g2_i1::g.13914::m.13914/K12188/SNF8, EAP30; ESCRT-II complex subunit VPS22